MTLRDLPVGNDISALKAACDAVVLPVLRGDIAAADELVLKGTLPGARMGMTVLVETDTPGCPLVAEVVGFRGADVTLMPLTRAGSVSPGADMASASWQGTIPCGDGLLGRIVSCLGQPLDSGPPLTNTAPWPLTRDAPNPLQRGPIDTQLVTGIRVLDGVTGIGIGQRIGLFAGPGLGKTTLLSMLANRASCDVNVVCLVGERGREVGEFVERALGREGLARSVLVLAPVDAPPQGRVRALDTATAVAEWFRDQGKHVLLLVDSLTRVVRAKREVGFALGEAASRSGYPASAFSTLPGLVERTGRSAAGSITAVYTVLTESTSDDPVSEEARSLLDGHIVLSEKRAKSGLWPAVDILRSVSRVAESIFSPEHHTRAQTLKRIVNAYEEHEDLIMMGAYRRGASPDTDAALEKKTAIDRFLAQDRGDASSLQETLDQLSALVGAP